MAGDNKIDDIEMEARIRVVQEYLLMDFGKGDIVAQCTAKWGICSRQAYNYINKAYSEFKKITEQNTQKRLNFHIQRRAKLLRDMDPAEKRTAQGTRSQLEILKDQAKLEGLYVEKHEHTGKGGGPIQTQTESVVTFKDYGQAAAPETEEDSDTAGEDD